MKNKSISKWIKDFDAGKMSSVDVMVQIKESSWYDWFCLDKSLRNKTYKLAPKVKKIANILGEKFQNTHYVFFKNNCPMCGSTYDDFRFCDMKTGDVVFTITPASGHDTDFGISEVWGKSNAFDGPLVTGNWKDVISYFKSLNK